MTAKGADLKHGVIEGLQYEFVDNYQQFLDEDLLQPNSLREGEDKKRLSNSKKRVKVLKTPASN